MNLAGFSLLAGAVAGAAVWTAAARPRRTTRLAELLRTQPPAMLPASASGQSAPGEVAWGERFGPRVAAALAAGVSVGFLLGGPAGLLAGVALGGGLAAWLGQLPSRAQRTGEADLQRALPVATDLLAACLLAGSTLRDALLAVAEGVGDPVGTRLRAGVALLDMGADPADCWRDWSDDPALAPLGRALARAAASGAPVADVVVRLADEQRTSLHWRAQEAARKVGVATVAPLGLCFLPAFLLLGIVPMALSMAGTVLPALSR